MRTGQIMSDTLFAGSCAATAAPDLHLVLHPHRSLSPGGFLVLMAALCAVSFTAGIICYLAGAWPVPGFMGLDVLGIYWAFRASYRSGRLFETIELTPDALVVQRFEPSGKAQRWDFQPYWLRVELDDPPQHSSQIVLTSHGRSLSVGSFLSPEERVEVAETIRRALHDYRSPRLS